MERMKYFRNWILIIIAFYIFSNALIYIYLHPDIVGGKIHNMIYKDEEVVNEVE